jgi:hypothetical protein
MPTMIFQGLRAFFVAVAVIVVAWGAYLLLEGGEWQAAASAVFIIFVCGIGFAVMSILIKFARRMEG